MKNSIIIFLVSLIFSACSQCYECSHVVEIEVAGQITQDTLTEDFCTAVQDEVLAKEAEGYTCANRI